MSLQESSPESLGTVVLRPFELRADREAVIRCVAALQDYERTLEPSLPPGAHIARRYVEAMLQRCAAYQGRIFVAEVDREVVAFVCVLARIPETAVDEYSRPHAAIGELFVDHRRRGWGLGRRLLELAEAHARERGADRLRVQVLAGNEPARSLYAGFGFEDRLVELEKRLPPAEDV
ncbi:MAG TPA: GNAT family N-acetyltransferase [Pseudomonadales bacterium]|nr:GNAT family N-acetyltransferase [Pseudomonadales bacterium]